MEKASIKSLDVCEVGKEISTMTDVSCPLEGKEHEVQKEDKFQQEEV